MPTKFGTTTVRAAGVSPPERRRKIRKPGQREDGDRDHAGDPEHRTRALLLVVIDLAGVAAGVGIWSGLAHRPIRVGISISLAPGVGVRGVRDRGGVRTSRRGDRGGAADHRRAAHRAETLDRGAREERLEGRGEARCRRPAVVGFDGERLARDGGQLRRDAGTLRGRVGNGTRESRHRHGGRAVALPRPMTGQQLVEHDPEREDVRRRASPARLGPVRG